MSQHILLAFGIVIFLQVKKKQRKKEYFPLTGTEVTTVRMRMKDTNYIEKKPFYQCLICCRMTKESLCLPKIQISILKCHINFSHVLDVIRTLPSVSELYQGTQYNYFLHATKCLVLFWVFCFGFLPQTQKDEILGHV